VTKFRRVEEKAAKHQLKVSVVWTGPKVDKITNSFVAINFCKFEDMVKFEEDLQGAIKELPKK
jgi:hypothetical protein